MGIAEIRGEKTGGGVGVQDHLGQTNYAEICILVTKYISKLNKIQITCTHTQPFNGPWSGTTLVGRYQKKHSPTYTHPDHQTSFIIFLHLQRNDLWHPLCSFYVLDSPLVQPLSRFSLVFHLVLDPQPHTPYISSTNHHLLFTAHAHTNAGCSAAIPMLCHLYLVSLSTPFLGVCLLA